MVSQDIVDTTTGEVLLRRTREITADKVSKIPNRAASSR
jgi:hypothetical protein